MLNAIARLFRTASDTQPRRRAKTRREIPRARRLVFEPMEHRMLLSVSLVGIPDWTDQGPGFSINGQAAGLTGPNPVVGAIEAIAARPGDANTISIGSVGGGIWRTTDGGTNWAPLTDQWPSLSIGALAYSPLDPGNNTLFAGTGSFSSGGNGGPAVGGLRSTDGGNSWVTIGSEFAGQRVRSIVPTAIGTSLANQVVLAATVDGGGGVWRSSDGGATFTRLSGAAGNTDGLDNDADGTIDQAGELNLPNLAATHLAPDPTYVNRFYASLPGAGGGVYRSDNGGANWVRLPGLNTAGATRIEVSVSAAGGAVYAGLLGGGALQNVFRSTDQGGTWTAIGVAPAVNPGGQGNTHFAILADRLANDIVYVSGDVQAASPFVGNVFRGDATAGTWTSIVLGGAAGTAPHADSRDMVFDAAGNILQANDGGIYRLVNANAPGTQWQAFAAMPRVSQFITNVDYDRLNNVIIGGTQDTGSPEQIAGFNWRDTSQADGGFTAVDNDQVAHPGTTIHYSSAQVFGNFTSVTHDNTNAPGASASVGLVVAGTGGSTLTKSVTIAGNQVLTFDNTVQFTQPFVLNSVNPARMLIGTNFLYESTDRGDNLTSLGGLNDLNLNTVDDDQDGSTDEGDEFTPNGAIGTVTAMVYGGRRGGADDADLALVASGATLRLRTANTTSSMADFVTVGGYIGGAIRDIEIDPDDWSRGYVLDTANRLFAFTKLDTAPVWANVTGNLASSSGDVRDIELYTATAAPGDDILLVSGFGGVFRTLAPSPTSQWSEYGQFMPNVIVTDLVYDAPDDVLIAGTYGRGAWKVSSVANTVATLGVLQITGDTDYAGQDDVIRILRDASNTSLLDVFINTDFFQFQLSTIQQINVDSLGGNDTLIIDSTNGLINVMNGIRYDGGDSSDALQLVEAASGPQRTSDTYSVGPGLGQGLSTIVGGGTFGTQVVRFDHLEPVLDTVVAATLTVNATAGDNAINYSAGSLVSRGLVTIDAYEPIEFANKTSLVINASAGADSVGINNAATPTALTSITVDGGDPGAGDAMLLTSTGTAVSVNTATATITGATGTSGAVVLVYSGLESLALGGTIGTLAFTTTAADDALTVTPGVSGTANSGTLVSSGLVPTIAFANRGDVSANLAGGNDTVTVTATANADAVAVGAAVVAIIGRNAVTYSGVESVSVNGAAGNDTFDVTPSLVAVFIDGGDPVGTLPGDLLNIIAGGQSVTYNAGPQTDEGSFGVGGNAPVSFDHIESFGITGSGPAIINGTNGNDAITVIARDGAFAGAADGVQDFTVSVNTGPLLLFIDVAALTVNALGGSDQITLVAPAPNNAVWNVGVAIDGGVPSAGTADQLVVQTPGGSSEAVVYSPTTANGGTLNLVSLTSLIALTEIESLAYDGQNDHDRLTVNGSGGNDTIVHNPGAADQSGSFAVNGLLAISYQNMGATALLGVNGNAGSTDTLVVNGTAVNDSFSVDGLGRIGLNTRLLISTASISTLTLEGMAGDDLFTLVPAVSGSVFMTMNFNGGSQASTTGDRVVLVGTAGADAITVSGQIVSLGGRTVNGSGIENIRLDALGGADEIIYNGVLGVSENINVSSSGVAGSGQISVPGVTLVDFAGVESIAVNGNTPSPTETDTLAFSGTNAPDLFTINLAAAGTTSDPVLKLQSSASTPPLLILRNYTNFNTLRINGLDGADTFNVYTADSTVAPDRNIFIDGGAPTAKKKSTDQLNVFYTPARPRIIQSAATQNPGSGLVDLAYTSRRYLVQYADIEAVTIQRGTVPV